jgi:phosphomevalonate kinase
MLSGEYAVVVGAAPAVACAVDLRLRVTCTVGGSQWRVTSTALGLNEAAVSQVPLLEAVVSRFAPPEVYGSFTVHSDLGAGNDKPGLGSSAALVVASAGALRHELGQPAPGLDELIACHQAGQGGGSGYDVATSLLGGVCLFQKIGGRHVARSLEWPKGLAARVLQLGSGVSSTGQLQKLDRAMAASPEEVGRALDQQCAAAVAVVAALDAGEDVLPVLARHEETLMALDRAARLDIESAVYSEVYEVLRGGDAILRTSGAGAGDSAWVLARSEQELKPALAALGEGGYGLLSVSVGGRGLEIEGGSR